MRTRRPNAAGLALACAIAGAACADTLVWTGKYGDMFDSWTPNWTNQATGAEAVFTGSNVARTEDLVFSVPTGENITVSITQSVNAVGMSGLPGFNPASILFDVDGEMLFTNTDGGNFLGWLNGPWVKRGAGKVTFTSASCRLFIKPAYLTIEEGTVSFVRPSNAYYGLMSYWFTDNKPITVKDGGTLSMSIFGMNADGGGSSWAGQAKYYTIEPKMKITVERGGKFHIDSNGVTGFTMMPELEFNDGEAFDFKDYKGYQSLNTGTGANGPGMFFFPKKITLNGTGAPYVWDALDSATVLAAAVNLWDSPLTEFQVADVDNGDGADFIMGLQLRDRYTNNTEACRVTAGFIKSGPGTMALTNHYNTLTGDIEVREGMLIAGPPFDPAAPYINGGNFRNLARGWSWIGAQGVERTIAVSNGATLYLPYRNTWGAYRQITNDVCGATTIYLDGTLKIREGEADVIPNLTVTGNARLCENSGMQGYGVMMVAGTFRVTGDKPFVWPWSNGTASNIGTTAYMLAGYPQTEFNIEDVTGDGSVDCTIHRPFAVNQYFLRQDLTIKYTLDDWAFGFRKTGAGTMRLTAAKFNRSSNTYAPMNGDATVEEGTLQLDGSLLETSSNVVVKAGAYVAGTGSVNNVVIEDGGGFCATAGATDALAICGDCSFGTGGSVNILAPSGLDRKTLNQPLARISGAVTGSENLAGWSVQFNGVDAEGPYRIRLSSAGVLSVRYARGTSLVFR